MAERNATGIQNEDWSKLIWRIKGLQLMKAQKLPETDEGRVKLAIDFLQINQDILVIKPESKSSAKAFEMINDATKQISKLPYKSLLTLYTKGLAYSPENSEAMAKAYANRSAILCNERLYEAALDDVGSALEIGYPDNLKAKLYVRRAKAVIARFPDTLHGVDNCLKEAQLWSEKMDPENKKKTQAAIQKLKVNKSVPAPREIWFPSEYLPSTPQGNSKILHASSAIALEYSKKFGRHVVATRDIQAGDTLSVHRSYASALYPENIYSHCWHCSNKMWNPIPCMSCVDVVFCDELCRTTAWNKYHDIECKLVGVMRRAHMCLGETIALKILLKALKETGSIDGLRNKIKDIKSISDPLTRLFTDGKFDDTKYASFYSLMRLPIDEITSVEYALKAAGLTYFIAALTDIFGRKINNYTDLFKNEDALFIAQLIYHHQVLGRTNTAQIEIENEVGEDIRVEGVVVPFIQLCNHSCDRNAYHFVADGQSALIAVQPIKQGEQIYCSLGPEYIHVETKKRRAILHTIYDFHCDCYACKHNWHPNSRHPSCLEQNLSEKAKETILKAKRMIEQQIYPPVTRHMTVEQKSVLNLPKRIACLIKFLNILDKHCKYPNLELLTIKYILIDHYHVVEGY
ncbi:SET and MYND domain-containing protein 4 [Microplitis demolitor]|uniref:SET and MYND domain-containing protein 4 n=1 Tax=Microplitis demolitor TaxID=69319 RepID=UPI0004CD066C|nr:SET and MYND domain-containing protein 4 [Microplitis demolitor]